MGKYLLAALLVLGLATAVYAAPVGLTSEADAVEGELWADNNLGVSAGFVVDGINSRKIDVDSGEYEATIYNARIGISLQDRFNVYVDLGQASDMEFEFSDKGDLIQCVYEDEFLWGIGVNALIYRWDNGLEVGAGANYRIADMNLDEMTVAGTRYKRSDASVTALTDGEMEEMQIALETAWRTDYFVPYIGIKYSDIEVDAKFTADGQERVASGADASTNFGVFAGLTILPKIAAFGDKDNRIAINIEGRFIDEEAVSVGATYTF